MDGTSRYPKQVLSSHTVIFARVLCSPAFWAVVAGKEHQRVVCVAVRVQCRVYSVSILPNCTSVNEMLALYLMMSTVYCTRHHKRGKVKGALTH